MGCLILGLEYIHSQDIIHRDIKPENLVCDSNGYIRITDFGVSKKNMPDNSSENSGTPGYMAPEVLMSKNHSFPVDFYAIGVMGYEFMMGQRPYLGKNRKEVREAVLAKQEKIGDNDIIKGWSKESANFINACLQRKEDKRLGYKNGVLELKLHPWFNGLSWKNLALKRLLSPFIPKPFGNYDKKYCEKIEKISPETIEKYEKIMKKESFLTIFNNYTFFNTSALDEKDMSNKHTDEDKSNLTKNTCTKVSTSIGTNNMTNKEEEKKDMEIKKDNKKTENRMGKTMQRSFKNSDINEYSKKINNNSFLKNRWDIKDSKQHIFNITNLRSYLNNVNEDDLCISRADIERKLKNRDTLNFKKNFDKLSGSQLFHLPYLKPSGSAQDIMSALGQSQYRIKNKDGYRKLSAKKISNIFKRNPYSKINYRYIKLKKSDSLKDYSLNTNKKGIA